MRQIINFSPTTFNVECKTCNKCVLALNRWPVDYKIQYKLFYNLRDMLSSVQSGLSALHFNNIIFQVFFCICNRDSSHVWNDIYFKTMKHLQRNIHFLLIMLIEYIFLQLTLRMLNISGHVINYAIQ